MFNPIPGNIIDLKRFFGGIRSNYSFTLRLLKNDFKFLTGIDYEFQNDDRKEYENNGVADYSSLSKSEVISNVSVGNNILNQKEKVNGLGAFSKIEFTPINDLSISFGLRYDKYKFSVIDNLLSDGVR